MDPILEKYPLSSPPILVSCTLASSTFLAWTAMRIYLSCTMELVPVAMFTISSLYSFLYISSLSLSSAIRTSSSKSILFSRLLLIVIL